MSEEKKPRPEPDYLVQSAENPSIYCAIYIRRGTTKAGKSFTSYDIEPKRHVKLPDGREFYFTAIGYNDGTASLEAQLRALCKIKAIKKAEYQVKDNFTQVQEGANQTAMDDVKVPLESDEIPDYSDIPF